jgi:hypothetical protein
VGQDQPESIPVTMTDDRKLADELKALRTRLEALEKRKEG